MAKIRMTLLTLLTMSLISAACGSTEVSTTSTATTPTTSTATEDAPEPAPETTSSVVVEPLEIDPSRITETWEEPGTDEIQLLVSNQSLEHEIVQISITINDEGIIENDYEAGDQHNFFSYNVNQIPPGQHTMTMRSDTGAELTRSFEKTDEPLWIIVHYWFDEYESKRFTFQLSDTQVEFA